MAFPSPFNLTLQCTCLVFYLWFRALAVLCMPFFFFFNLDILAAQHIPVTTGKRNIPFSARGAPAGENGLGEFSQRGTSNLKCMKLDSPAREIHLSMSPCGMPRNQISNLDEQPRLPSQNWARLLFILPLYLFSHSLWFSLTIPFIRANTCA